MPTLTRDTRCACCGKPMKAGDAFRWYERPARHVAKGVKGIPARFVPAHEDVLCSIRDKEAEQAAMEAEAKVREQQIIAALASGMSFEEIALMIGIPA